MSRRPTRPRCGPLTLFPGLEIEQKGARVEVSNAVMRTRLTASKDLLKLFAFFDRPRGLDEILEAFDVERADIDELRDRFVLVEASDVDVLAPGLLRSAATPIGEPATLGDLAGLKRGAFAVLGAPVDVASSGGGGARHGPFHVRECFRFANILSMAGPIVDFEMRRRLAGPRKRVLDFGDVLHQPGEGSEVFAERLRRVIDRLLGAGTVPVTIGGDHSVTWPVLDVLLRRTPRLGVIHFDAHHDMYPSRERRVTHANPFFFALERRELEVLFQVGLRTIEPMADRVEVADARVRYASSRDLQSASPEEVFAGLPTSIPYYVSFDVDVMDPLVAPETGTPVSGGLSYYQALELLDHAYRRFNVIGADFVEVSAGGSRSNAAAKIVANYLLRLLLSRERFTPFEGSAFAFKSPRAKR